MSQKFCPQCGASQPETAKFCQQCGAPFELAPENKTTQPEMVGANVVGSTVTPAPEIKEHKTLKVADGLPRIVAFIVDLIFLAVINMCLNWLVPALKFDYLAYTLYPPSIQITSWGLLIADMVKGFLIYLAYFTLLEAFNKGQTIGKVLLNLQSVTEQKGEPVTGKQAFLMSITKSDLLLILIDLLAGLTTQQKPNLKQIRLVQRLTGVVIVKKNA